MTKKNMINFFASIWLISCACICFTSASYRLVVYGKSTLSRNDYLVVCLISFAISVLVSSMNWWHLKKIENYKNAFRISLNFDGIKKGDSHGLEIITRYLTKTTDKELDLLMIIDEYLAEISAYSKEEEELLDKEINRLKINGYCDEEVFARVEKLSNITYLKDYKK